MVGLLSKLEHLMNAAAAAEHVGTVTAFDSQAPLPMTVSAYLHRWMRYTGATEAELLSAMVLIDRYCCASGEDLTQYNMARLLLAALVIAQKAASDQPYSMVYYSRVGGVTPSQLCQLERALLQDIAWSVYVGPEDLGKYRRCIEGAGTRLSMKAVEGV